MRITLYSDYSVRVLLYLKGKHGKSASLTELADFYGISRNHLMKVVRNLRLKGFVITEKGRGGGIWLARPADEIKIGEVMRHAQRDFDASACSTVQRGRVGGACHLDAVLSEASAAFIKVLDDRTLGDIASGRRIRVGRRTSPL